MRIGISVCSSYRVEDPREGARFMVERADAARRAGLDSLFVGDHHVTPSPYFQNTAILGRMLAAWGDKPCGALYLLPLWNPVLLAEQTATLASIAEGPFIMQCGLGGEARQSAGMGVDIHKRAAMFEASLEMLRTLWAGEEVTETKYWNVTGARISPVPPEPIEVWVGSAVPKAINRTARMAEGWLASPGLTLQQAADSLNRYRQACAEHLREPTAVAIRRDIYIGPTREDARKVVEPYIQRGYRGFSEEALMFGSVAEVVEELAAFAALGYTDVIVRNISSDQGEALATIERLAEVKEQVEASTGQGL
ncbi:MAG: LLM class flavin-dependent oxidoreductase [Gammaproteobacteria bacterium]|nr:LLM class flavin-dependent oxidoreductase [Gammaproteobacteria bacterium]MCZ6855033.1 LLM class flavin-dependent oxidoreductase [Gammaproteobacteria bacterium]